MWVFDACQALKKQLRSWKKKGKGHALLAFGFSALFFCSISYPSQGASKKKKKKPQSASVALRGIAIFLPIL
jgi:hypothetical protein